MLFIQCRLHTIRSVFLSGLVALLFSACTSKKDEGWIDLFNGSDLSGWEQSEGKQTFTVADGHIIAHGPRSHLFYTGPVANGDFKNFELRADLMTFPGANSGVYFHTAYADSWPSKGFEVQVNNTHIGLDDFKEYKKSGSLYGLRNIFKAFADDSVWFNMHIWVEGNHVRIEVDGKKVVDYIQPDDTTVFRNRLSHGTFALQGHDPNSMVWYRSIKVKILPDDVPDAEQVIIINDTHKKMMQLQGNQYAFADLGVGMLNSFDADDAMQFMFRTGINLGMTVPSDASYLSARVDQYHRYPVFVGLRINDIGSMESIPLSVLDRVDYTIASVETASDSVADTQQYMDLYVARVIRFLNSGVDIWSKATELPDSLMPHYDSLWTPERMESVVQAAAKSGTAVEINNSLRLPSLAFIKKAREHGCQFTFSGIYGDAPMGNLDYVFEVIEMDSLDYRDIYMPGAPWLEEPLGRH